VLATDTSSTLAFNFRNGQSFWLLDNVAVTAVPEAPINALFGAGLVVVAALVRRRNHAPRWKQNAREVVKRDPRAPRLRVSIEETRGSRAV